MPAAWSRPEFERATHVGMAVVAVAVALFLPARAGAEQPRNLDLPRFDPAPAGDRFFGVPSAYTPGNAPVHLEALVDYAHDPLILVDPGGKTSVRVVEHQLLVHLSTALMLFSRFQVNADLPFAPLNRGQGTFESRRFNGADAFVSPDGAGLGDLRLGVRTQIVGEYIAALQIALGTYLWLPTGSRNDFLTDGHPRAQFQLLAGGYVEHFIWSAMVGPTLRSSQSYGGIEIGSQLNWGAGIGVVLGDVQTVQLGVESTGGVTLRHPQSDSTNGEVLVGIRYRPTVSLIVGAAVSRGVAPGPGTPDFRSIFSLSYAPAPTPAR
jgi:OOP family OmpA-OmpF porin